MEKPPLNVSYNGYGFLQMSHEVGDINTKLYEIFQGVAIEIEEGKEWLQYYTLDIFMDLHLY